MAVTHLDHPGMSRAEVQAILAGEFEGIPAGPPIYKRCWVPRLSSYFLRPCRDIGAKREVGAGIDINSDVEDVENKATNTELVIRYLASVDEVRSVDIAEATGLTLKQVISCLARCKTTGLAESPRRAYWRLVPGTDVESIRFGQHYGRTTATDVIIEWLKKNGASSITQIAKGTSIKRNTVHSSIKAAGPDVFKREDRQVPRKSGEGYNTVQFWDLA